MIVFIIICKIKAIFGYISNAIEINHIKNSQNNLHVCIYVCDDM